MIRINYIPRTVYYEALKFNNNYYCYGTPTEVCPLSKQIITFQEQAFRISVLSPFSRSTQEAMYSTYKVILQHVSASTVDVEKQ
jgi:hypothetical protein